MANERHSDAAKLAVKSAEFGKIVELAKRARQILALDLYIGQLSDNQTVADAWTQIEKIGKVIGEDELARLVQVLTQERTQLADLRQEVLSRIEVIEHNTAALIQRIAASTTCFTSVSGIHVQDDGIAIIAEERLHELDKRQRSCRRTKS